MGIYSIDSITRYINFYNITRKRNAKYPFAIFNTDKDNKPGTHWWNFLDIHPKKNYCCLITLELMDLIIFLLIMIKILQIDYFITSKNDQKLSLCSLQLSIEDWEKLEQSKKEKLTDTAQNFFHLLTEFAKQNDYSNSRRSGLGHNIKHMWVISTVFL